MNKLIATSAFSIATLLATSAAFAWDKPPTSDPNNPNLKFSLGLIADMGPGNQCMWVNLDSDPVHTFIISANDPAVFTYDSSTRLLQYAYSTVKKVHNQWTGQPVNIEYDPNAPTDANSIHCATKGGTPILGVTMFHTD